MTNEEVKKALFDESPVEHKGIQYKCITAIIYRRKSEKEVIVLAELMDRNKNSVSIAPIKDVKIIKGSE